MFRILDCSLRDGGYYTNWDFPAEFVDNYLRAIRTLPVDFVEVGYRSPPVGGYKGQYFYLSPEDLTQIRDALRKDQKLAVMLNAKDCTPEIVHKLIEPVQDIVDVVRFACPPTALDKGIELARVVSSFGVEVAMNVMYLNQYIDDAAQLSPLADAADCIQYVALVDSYGGCFPDDVEKAFRAVTALLPQPIGFHGHDNISLAFANSLAALKGGGTMVDSTLSGMGRGAGNLTTELICAYKEKSLGAEVNYTNLASTLDDFSAMKDYFKWGTSLPYIVSGMSGLPQAQVMDWLGKRRYRPSTIIAALRGQAQVGLDEREFENFSDAAADMKIDQKTAVVIGGGDSVTMHASAIERFARDQDAIVLHSSLRHMGKLDPSMRQLVCLAGQELRNTDERTVSEISDTIAAWILSSPPRLPDAVPAEGRIVQVSLPPEFEEGQLGPISDVAPLELAIAAALEAGCTRVFLAGFDGYENASASDIELMASVQNAIYWFRQEHPEIEFASLLPTQYDIDVRSVYARDLKLDKETKAAHDATLDRV